MAPLVPPAHPSISNPRRWPLLAAAVTYLAISLVVRLTLMAARFRRGRWLVTGWA